MIQPLRSIQVLSDTTSGISRSEHRPGYVRSANGPVRIEKGQRWLCPAKEHLLYNSSPVLVVGIEDGAVFLRPTDETPFREAFTRQETNKQGQPVDVLAFKEMGSGFKKGAPDEWKNGTFAAHEAWDVWQRMILEPSAAPTSPQESAASEPASGAPGS